MSAALINASIRHRPIAVIGSFPLVAALEIVPIHEIFPQKFAQLPVNASGSLQFLNVNQDENAGNLNFNRVETALRASRFNYFLVAHKNETKISGFQFCGA